MATDTKCNLMCLGWTQTPETTKQYEKEELRYDFIWKHINFNCPKSPITNLNKELAIETANVNRNLVLKEELIKLKMDFQFRMRAETDFPMSDQVYDEKIDWLMARHFKLEFFRTDDKKFRHSPEKFQNFYTLLPVVKRLLNKPELKSLREYLYGEENMDFEFSKEWLEAKEEFMIFHAQQVQRTEKNSNIEFDNFLTTCDNTIIYGSGHNDDRLPLRDPFRM